MSREQMDAELDALNEAVKQAIDARTQWMNDHMTHYAKWQVGEELFDLETGRRVGVVSRLYRFHGPQHDGDLRCRDDRFDTSMSVEYEVRERDNIFGNSSCCHGMYRWGTREELANRLRNRLEALAPVEARKTKETA